jgi:zinc protease
MALLAAVTLAAWPTSAAAPAAVSAGRDDGRIIPDPAIRRGVLPNGLRYAIMPNASPSQALSFRLGVRVGAFDEDYGEQGVAHFLEHMAFGNGQRWDLSGAEAAFAALGVSFGRDQNAETSRFSTVFTLDLPRADAASTDLAFKWLRGVASKTTFTPDAVEQERRIILQELTERTNGTTLINDRVNAFVAPGLKSEQDDVGGSPEAVRAATPATLEAFYRRWYRPDNAVLVIVGDASPDALEQKLRQVFSDWTATGPALVRRPLIVPDTHRAEDALVIADTHAPTTQTVCRLTEAPADRSDTVAKHRRELLSQLWVDILTQRLGDLARGENPPFLQVTVLHLNGREAERSCVGIVVYREDWPKALASVQDELLRLANTDPTDDELERAINHRRALARGELHAAQSRSSAQLAAEIAESDLSDQVFPAPYEAFRTFDAAVADVTPADIRSAFKRDWTGAGPLLALVAPAPPTAEALRVTWDKLIATASAPVGAAKLNAWAYTNFGPPGRVVKRETYQSPDFVRLTFSNGVTLNFKQTSFQSSNVQIVIRVGAGRHELTAANLVEAQIGASFVVAGGLGRHDYADVQKLFSESAASATLSVGANAFVLTGNTNGPSLLGQLQLLAAYLSDPGFRPAVDDRLAAGVDLLYRQIHAQPELVFGNTLSEAVAPGGPLALPPKDVLLKLHMKDYAQLLQPVLTQAPLEVTIVGDVTEASATELVAQTLGALPARRQGLRDRPDAWFIHYAAGDLPTVRATHEGPADKAVVGAVWPLYVAEPARRREEMALSVLKGVLDDALRHRLREELGLTYGANVSMTTPDFGDQGDLEAYVQTSPADADKVAGEIQAVARRLALGQFSDADVEAARKPLVAAMNQQMGTNLYWAGELSGAETLQDDIDEIRQTPILLAAVTPDEVRKVAMTWLVRKPLVVVVAPAPSQPPDAANAPTAR